MPFEHILYIHYKYSWHNSAIFEVFKLLIFSPSNDSGNWETFFHPQYGFCVGHLGVDTTGSTPVTSFNISVDMNKSYKEDPERQDLSPNSPPSLDETFSETESSQDSAPNSPPSLDETFLGTESRQQVRICVCMNL
jgi:hypothetical protein